jgi:DNA-binding MarR family transcriptional regulator
MLGNRVTHGKAPTKGEDAERLRSLVQAFIRRFGLLLGNQTPCGQPVSPSHAHALTVLLEHRRARVGALCQADLGEALGIDKSNVARLCVRMEGMGHVEQVRAPHDGRSRLVSLTPAGMRLARSVERSSRERFRRLLESVPSSRRGIVLEGLAALDAALVLRPGSTS